MPLKAGDTFFMPDTGGAFDSGKAHLMICVLGPDEKGDALIVPLVTCRPYSDHTCVLNVGDHPFIKHKSCISFDRAKKVPATSIDSSASNFKPGAPVTAAVLNKIRKGLLASKETAPFVTAYAKARHIELIIKRAEEALRAA